MINADTTGQKICELRKRKHLTQRDLAEKLHISGAAVSKWERGLNFPDLLLLEPLAEILEVSPAELLDLENKSADQVLTEITEISKEERAAKKSERKKQLGLLLAVFLIFLILFNAFLFLGRDTPENNAVWGTFDFQNIMLLPLFFGLAAWGFGIASVLSRCGEIRQQSYSSFSFCFCAAALYVTILIFDTSLRFGDYASLDDTAWGYHFCSMALLLGTILLNLFSILRAKKKKR